MPKKHKVVLGSDQRKKLLRFIKTGHHKAREILYAHVLLKSAQGWTDEQIARRLISARTQFSAFGRDLHDQG